jgi:hypothetical protein
VEVSRRGELTGGARHDRRPANRTEGKVGSCPEWETRIVDMVDAIVLTINYDMNRRCVFTEVKKCNDPKTARQLLINTATYQEQDSPLSGSVNTNSQPHATVNIAINTKHLTIKFCIMINKVMLNVLLSHINVTVNNDVIK